MKEPVGCVFWEQPELAFEGPIKTRFERIETILKDDNWWRYLLKCRECGQLYFFEFYEETDWEGGNDPQFSVLIPVESDAEIKSLQVNRLGLLKFFPRLHKDLPKAAKKPKVVGAK